MGCEGTWKRWIRKPSISKAGKVDVEDLDNIPDLTGSIGDRWHESACDADTYDMSLSTTDVPAVFDANLDDETAFPALASEKSPAKGIDALTPEKFQKPTAHVETSKEDSHVDDEMGKEWVVVPSADDGPHLKPQPPTTDGHFDAQHPRNMFAKRPATKAVTPKDDTEKEECGMDWSKAGMPLELISRLIRGSANSAHQNFHSQSKASTLPTHIMRSQNIGSSKRQTSTPKTPPRSQSKPRTMKQPSGRR